MQGTQGNVCQSVCLSVFVSVCLLFGQSVCLSVCLSVCCLVCLSICEAGTKMSSNIVKWMCRQIQGIVACNDDPFNDRCNCIGLLSFCQQLLAAYTVFPILTQPSLIHSMLNLVSCFTHLHCIKGWLTLCKDCANIPINIQNNLNSQKL